MVGKTFTYKPKRYKTAAQKVVKTVYTYTRSFILKQQFLDSLFMCKFMQHVYNYNIVCKVSWKPARTFW